jgi:hypothetical protein
MTEDGLQFFADDFGDDLAKSGFEVRHSRSIGMVHDLHEGYPIPPSNSFPRVIWAIGFCRVVAYSSGWTSDGLLGSLPAGLPPHPWSSEPGLLRPWLTE